jgi:hypothetical protein
MLNPSSFKILLKIYHGTEGIQNNLRGFMSEYFSQENICHCNILLKHVGCDSAILILGSSRDICFFLGGVTGCVKKGWSGVGLECGFSG